MDWYALCLDDEPVKVRQFPFEPTLFDFNVIYSSDRVPRFSIRRCVILLED